MSSASVCRNCVRALKQGARAETRTLRNSTHTSRTPLASRPFSTTTSPQQTTPQASSYNTSSPDSSTMHNLAAKLRASKALGGTTEPYVAYGSTQHLFALCTPAGEYSMPVLAAHETKPATSAGEDLGLPAPGTWYTHYNLIPTFNTWAQITFVHMYLLTVRIRMFPADHAKHWHQNLLDHFFYAAEDRMARLHGMEARSVRNKYLKDLFVQWRGVLAGYDEGVIKGDAVLASAVWRNVFVGREDVDAVHVAEVVAFIRSELRRLDDLKDAQVADGFMGFEDAKKVAGLVMRESKGVKEAFADGAAR